MDLSSPTSLSVVAVRVSEVLSPVLDSIRFPFVWTSSLLVRFKVFRSEYRAWFTHVKNPRRFFRNDPAGFRNRAGTASSPHPLFWETDSGTGPSPLRSARTDWLASLASK